MQVVTDERWLALEPLLDAVRPRAPRPIRCFRRTIEAIVWRLGNGAKWRAAPAEFGPSAGQGLPPCGTDDRLCRSW